MTLHQNPRYSPEAIAHVEIMIQGVYSAAADAIEQAGSYIWSSMRWGGRPDLYYWRDQSWRSTREES